MSQPIYIFNVTTVTKDMSHVYSTYPTWFKYNPVGNADVLGPWYKVTYKLQENMLGWIKQHSKDSNDLVVAVPSYVEFHIEKLLADMIARKENQALFDVNRNLLNLPGHDIN